MFFFNKKSKLLNEAQQKIATLESENKRLTETYSLIIDVDKAIDQKRQELLQLNNELITLKDNYQLAHKTYESLRSEIFIYSDSLDIGSFGLYEPQFSFETSEQYKTAVTSNYETQKMLIKLDTAAICKLNWTVQGSQAEGKKMTDRYKKLMLYAFNGECDSLISKVKWNNAAKTKERIRKAYENINKLGETHQVSISDKFYDLKLKEFQLTYEYEQKKFEEKEEQRRIREQMKEEEKAQKEFEKALREAEDEERRYQKALEKAKQELRASGHLENSALAEQVKILEGKVLESQQKKERAISLAQLTKTGHIYIISNIGSFGEDVYKIGMTRRVDPLERVYELGSAAVPFHFDVHAVIYSDNAPQLEFQLHNKFRDKRLNRINNRKEFYKVSLDEIVGFIQTQTNAEIQVTKLAEAKEYRETLTLLEQLKNQLSQKILESKFPNSLV